MKLLALILALALGSPVEAISPEVPPVHEEEFLTEERRQQREDFAGIRVDERLGESFDLHIPFVDHRGEHVLLSDYASDERPLVITFVYHDCPMLCSLVLDGLTSALADTRLRLGQDYSVVAVSIDPRDTPEAAAAAHARYARSLGTNDDPEAYVFLTGEQASIDRLAGATGFRYEWLEDRQEFAHNATLVFVSPSGLISRYLYGLQFPALDFRRAVIEAGEGKVGSPIDQLLLYCFAYDPDAGGYVLQAANAMRVGGLLTFLVLLVTLLLFWRREAIDSLRGRVGGGRWSDYEDALRTSPNP